jgi:hypothetical protein
LCNFDEFTPNEFTVDLLICKYIVQKLIKISSMHVYKSTAGIWNQLKLSSCAKMVIVSEKIVKINFNVLGHENFRHCRHNYSLKNIFL